MNSPIIGTDSVQQCLTVDHEVLTDNGWKAISAVQVADRVMTLDLNTGTQDWNAVEATTRAPHTGPLYRLKSGGMDAVCDENHRWYLNTKDLPGIYTAFTTRQMVNGQLAPKRDSKGANKGHWDRKSGTTAHKNHKIPSVGRNVNSMYLWPDCAWLSTEFVEDEASNLDWCRFVGLIMGDGRIQLLTSSTGRETGVIRIFQSASKPDAKKYIEELFERLAASDPGFVIPAPIVRQQSQMYVWTITHRGMYDFFLPMIRGPQSYDPLDDAMCKAYQAPHYRTLSKSGNEQVLPSPAGWKKGNWWYLRRWFYYDWLFLLSRNQARAIIKGIAVADGEWATVLKARSDTGGTGRGGGKNGKKVKLSSDDVQKAVPLISRAYVVVFNSSIPLMHDLSVLGHLADTRVSFGLMHKKGDWMPSIGIHANANGWRIAFAFADSELTVAAPKPEPYQNPHHDGFVYCLTVPNGNFLARRTVEYTNDDNAQQIQDVRQKPFYTGNCKR